MRLQILTLAMLCLVAAPAWAGAGLTSAGADPTPTNNQQDEPTLAQVAPTQGTSGTAAAGTSAAGTVVPGTVSGTAAPQASTVTPGGTAAGASTGGATAPATALVATPPPPPDPATLPVSVIRPLNKDVTNAPAAAADAPAASNTAISPQQTRVSTPSATPARPVATPPAQSIPAGGLRAAATSPSPSPHADAATRPPVETPADEPADASSSGFIFYTGVGIAATILLLSFAAFFRGGGAETGKPGSM